MQHAGSADHIEVVAHREQQWPSFRWENSIQGPGFSVDLAGEYLGLVWRDDDDWVAAPKGAAPHTGRYPDVLSAACALAEFSDVDVKTPAPLLDLDQRLDGLSEVVDRGGELSDVAPVAGEVLDAPGLAAQDLGSDVGLDAGSVQRVFLNDHGSPSIVASGLESRVAPSPIVGAASGVEPSTTPDAPSTPRLMDRFSDALAAEFRAEMAAQNLGPSDLADVLGISVPRLERRLSGDLSFNVIEMAVGAQWLGLAPDVLVRRAEARCAEDRRTGHALAGAVQA